MKLTLLSVPESPCPIMPSELNEHAKLALPFVGALAGIDECFPTKAVYAIYDCRIHGLRLVHGDGTFIAPEGVIFSKNFNDGRSKNLSRIGKTCHKLTLGVEHFALFLVPTRAPSKPMQQTRCH